MMIHKSKILLICFMLRYIRSLDFFDLCGPILSEKCKTKMLDILKETVRRKNCFKILKDVDSSDKVLLLEIYEDYFTIKRQVGNKTNNKIIFERHKHNDPVENIEKEIIPHLLKFTQNCSLTIFYVIYSTGYGSSYYHLDKDKKKSITTGLHKNLSKKGHRLVYCSKNVLKTLTSSNWIFNNQMPIYKDLEAEYVLDLNSEFITDSFERFNDFVLKTFDECLDKFAKEHNLLTEDEETSSNVPLLYILSNILNFDFKEVTSYFRDKELGLLHHYVSVLCNKADFKTNLIEVMRSVDVVDLKKLIDMMISCCLEEGSFKSCSYEHLYDINDYERIEIANKIYEFLTNLKDKTLYSNRNYVEFVVFTIFLLGKDIGILINILKSDTLEFPENYLYQNYIVGYKLYIFASLYEWVVAYSDWVITGEVTEQFKKQIEHFKEFNNECSNIINLMGKDSFTSYPACFKNLLNYKIDGCLVNNEHK